MSLVNDARLVARGLRSAVSAPALPWKLTCAVTWRCAQRCTHCRIWRRPAGDELTVAQWARVFASVGPALSWLDLTGGEVTSRADFGALARAALDACPSLALLHFPTNGENPGAVEAVARELQGGHARFVVSISLDGPPQLHDRLRGDPGAFDRAVDTWRRLRSLGVESYFGMTLSDYTVAHVDATRAALADAVPGFRRTTSRTRRWPTAPGAPHPPTSWPSSSGAGASRATPRTSWSGSTSATCRRTSALAARRCRAGRWR